MELESNNKINFLDITIAKESNKLSFSVYRKPTATDTIIHARSCHPPEHKQAAVRFLMNRLNTYDLSNDNKRIEQHTIQCILKNHGYPTSLIKQDKKHHREENKTSQRKGPWAKFTYIGKQTKFITKLFKQMPIRVTYTTNNTIGKLLTHKPECTQCQNQYDLSGIYQLVCPVCKMKYVGQTGRPFRKRYQEHFRDFKYNNNKSRFAAHLLENSHSIGPIDDIMKTVHVTKKGRTMDTLERFHIHVETRNNNQINDKNTIKPNAIFEAISSHSPQ
jgi:hypothetical protein